MTLPGEAFENIVRQGENSAHQHFFLFPQCFLRAQRQSPRLKIFSLISINAFNKDKSKILSCSTELICLGDAIQSPKNPLVRSSFLGKTWSGHVDYPSLSNYRTSAKWQVDE